MWIVTFRESLQRLGKVYHLTFAVVNHLHTFHPSFERMRLDVARWQSVTRRECHRPRIIKHRNRPLAPVLPNG